MTERKVEIISYAGPTTRDFLKASINDGAVDRLLKDARKNLLKAPLHEVVRNLNLAAIYFSTSLTAEEMFSLIKEGKLFDNPGAWIPNKDRMIGAISLVIHQLHTYSSEDTRRSFALNEIKIGKPRGTQLEVLNLLYQGATWRDIKKGRGESSFRNLKRKVTDNWLNPVLVREGAYAEFERQLNSSRTAEDVAEVLKKVTLRIYHEDQDKEKGSNLLVTVTKVARSRGFVFGNQQIESFLEILKESEIPFKKIETKTKGENGRETTQSYYIMAKVHEYLAERIWKASSKLSNFLRK